MENINNEIGVPLTHVEVVRDRTIPLKNVARPETYISILHTLLDNSPVEQFITLYIHNDMLVGVERTALGQASMVAVSMSEIFRGAILVGATHIVVGHNHTNNISEPSDQDLNLTDCVMRASALLKIGLIDHIIVSPDGTHYSMLDNSRHLERRVMDMYYKNMLTSFPWDLKKYHVLPGLDLNKKRKDYNDWIDESINGAIKDMYPNFIPLVPKK